METFTWVLGIYLLIGVFKALGLWKSWTARTIGHIHHSHTVVACPLNKV